MDVHRLDRIFKPQRIALVGVTENPKGVSGTVLRNLVGSGFRGVVYPVNPACEAVAGVSCYPSVRELPRTPDLAVVCSPAEEVPAVVRACGEAGILGLVIVSAGFRETGPAGAALEVADHLVLTDRFAKGASVTLNLPAGLRMAAGWRRRWH